MPSGPLFGERIRPFQATLRYHSGESVARRLGRQEARWKLRPCNEESPMGQGEAPRRHLPLAAPRQGARDGRPERVCILEKRKRGG